MTTTQEQAWTGKFGDDYHDRAPGSEEANFEMLIRALGPATKRTGGLGINTVLELGCGTGANLRALARLFPHAELHGVEINPSAIATLQKRHPPKYLQPNVWRGSVLDFQPQRRFDLVVTKGFLIHIAPAELQQVYNVITQAAARWILIAEYYNPRHVPITYRGEKDLLWKGDFAGDLLERHPLDIVNYGFCWHRDAHCPQDDLTWFLLEKRHANPDLGVR